MVDQELLKLIIVLVLAIISALTGNKILVRSEVRKLLNSNPGLDQVIERLARLEERTEGLRGEIENIRKELERIRDRLGL